jgi:hypothetical protein
MTHIGGHLLLLQNRNHRRNTCVLELMPWNGVGAPFAARDVELLLLAFEQQVV